MARPVLRRRVVGRQSHRKAPAPAAIGLPVAGLQEGLELSDGDRIARDPEGIDSAGQAFDDLRVRVVGVGADLDRHLAALDPAPVDVRQTVGPQALRRGGGRRAGRGAPRRSPAPRGRAAGARRRRSARCPASHHPVRAEGRQLAISCGSVGPRKASHRGGPRRPPRETPLLVDLAHGIQDALLGPEALRLSARSPRSSRPRPPRSGRAGRAPCGPAAASR